MHPFVSSARFGATLFARIGTIIGVCASAAAFGCGGSPREAEQPPATMPLATLPPADVIKSNAVLNPAAELGFEVPKLDHVTIDGSADDWKQGGLLLDVLAPSPADSRDASFDARERVAWDERGLLLSVDVTDPSPLENATIWKGDSVEVFLGDSVGGKNIAHFMVAPGVAAGFGELRSNMEDQRSDPALKGQALSSNFARKARAGGYVVEGLIPWQTLGIKPAPGKELAVQTYVTNAEAGKGSRKLLWFPVDGAWSDSKRMQRVRLSEHKPAPITVAGAVMTHGFDARVLLATSDRSSEVRATLAGKELPTPKFEKQGRLWLATLDVPADGERFGPLDVFANGSNLARLQISNLVGQRRQSLDRIAVVAKPSVFGSSQLPNIDFEQPAVASELLGRATIKVTYYDANHQAVTSAEKPGRYGAVVDVTAENGKSFRRRLTLFRMPKDMRWRDVKFEVDVATRDDIGITQDVLKHEKRIVGDWFRDLISDSAMRSDRSAVVLAALFEKGQPKTGKATPPAPTFKDLSRDSAATANQRFWHEQQRLNGDLDHYQYLAAVPEGATAGAGKRFPLIIFLHGSGERGSDPSILETWGPVEQAKRKDLNFPFIVIAPQCPEGESWNTSELDDLLAEVEAKYPVDTDRVYLTGLSMGGFGTWRWAAERPETFAAVAPVCGGGEIADASVLKDTPIWVFHGDKDPAVAPERSKEMVNALRSQQGRVRFTLYPGVGHESWLPTYKNQALYAWFLEQQRSKPKFGHATKRGGDPDLNGSEVAAQH